MRLTKVPDSTRMKANTQIHLQVMESVQRIIVQLTQTWGLVSSDISRQLQVSLGTILPK